MGGCELCRRDGELSELYCHDCGKWICTVCGTVVHFAMKGTGDHDIITAEEQRRRLAQPLKHQLTYIHAKMETYSQRIRQCAKETTVLNQSKVTSLELSSTARQSCHKQIDQLFDSIDKRLQSFAVTNTATYMLAEERLTYSMTQLRQLQCTIEEALYKISSDASSVDADLTLRIQASLDEISSGANECVAAGATAPKLYLSLNDKLSLDVVASLDEVGGSNCDDKQQPKARVIKFDRNICAEFVMADSAPQSDVSDVEGESPARQLNVTSSRSRSPADDVDATAAAGAGRAHDSDGVVMKQKKNVERMPDSDAPAVKHTDEIDGVCVTVCEGHDVEHARESDVHDVILVEPIIDDRDALQSVSPSDAQAASQSDVYDVEGAASPANQSDAGATQAMQRPMQSCDVPVLLIGNEDIAQNDIEDCNAQSADDDNGGPEDTIEADLNTFESEPTDTTCSVNAEEPPPPKRPRVVCSRLGDDTIEHMVPCVAATAEGTEARDPLKQRTTQTGGAPKPQTTRSGRPSKPPNRYGEFSLNDDCEQSLSDYDERSEDDDVYSGDSDDAYEFDHNEHSLNDEC